MTNKKPSGWGGARPSRRPDAKPRGPAPRTVLIKAGQAALVTVNGESVGSGAIEIERSGELRIVVIRCDAADVRIAVDTEA